jgi:hypothetical protein
MNICLIFSSELITRCVFLGNIIRYATCEELRGLKQENVDPKKAVSE